MRSGPGKRVVAAPAVVALSGPAHAVGMYLVTGLGNQGSDFSCGLSINNLGHVAGYYGTYSGAMHAFSTASGCMLDLRSLDGGKASAYGINDVGQSTGGSESGGQNRALRTT